MRNTLTLFVLSLLVISVIPGVLASSVGGGVTPDIGTEDFAPLVWMCDQRVVYDDKTEPGRLFHEVPGGLECQDQDNDGFTECNLWERVNNYAFEGEQIHWLVLVMDKNGIEKLSDVYGTIGTSQGEGNDIEVNCDLIGDGPGRILDSCNARILEEQLEWNDQVMQYYDCTFTVETPDSMYGEYWITVEAEDLDGLLGTMDENEYWYLNPVIALSIDGELTFEDVRPGVSAYSDTLLIGNDADASSGVLMDMFISGTDFYDSDSSGAMCPTTNQLKLGDGDSDCDVGEEFGGNDDVTDTFCYYATSGAYSTQLDDRNDAEGYVGINYGIGFNDPNPFYGDFNGDEAGFEIIQGPKASPASPYFIGNVLSPGAEQAVTFRLNLPEPCNGDFDTGAIYFWGEAI